MPLFSRNPQKLSFRIVSIVSDQISYSLFELFCYLHTVSEGEYDPAVGMDGGVVDMAQPQAVGIFEREGVGGLYLQQKSLKGRALAGGHL